MVELGTIAGERMGGCIDVVTCDTGPFVGCC